MPPDTSTSYDLHLLKSMHVLSDLGSSMATDVFVSYCPTQSWKSAKVHPNQAKALLEKAGYTWLATVTITESSTNQQSLLWIV